jgi:ABC-type branched-subunit amino acid transport system ATPase component
MSVLDNVLVGAHLRLKSPLWKLILGADSVRRNEQNARSEACSLIEEVGLSGMDDKPVGELSFGQGRLLEIARALAAHPRVMLFDEPAAGLTPSEVTHLAKLVRAIASRGISVLLIEHDMRFLLPLVDRAVVLNFGEKIADGTPEIIRTNQAVVDAYLGADA